MIRLEFDGTHGGHVLCGVTAHGSPGGPLQFELLEAALSRQVPLICLLLTSSGVAMSFCAIGFAIMIGGLMYGAYLVHTPVHWIAVGAVMLLGIGILTGVKTARQKAPVG
jgi:hypothetical protein